MRQNSVYPSALQAFRLVDAPMLTARVLNHSVLSVAELAGPANHGLTSSVPHADSYIVQLRLLECHGCDYFVEGRHVDRVDHRAGVVQVHDLSRDPTAHVRDPFHVMHLHLPRSALAASIEQFCHTPVGDVELVTAPSFRDPLIGNLLHALRPSLAQPEETSSLFVEPIMQAMCIHLASQYGGMPVMPPVARGTLSAWQERRVRELFDGSPAAAVTLTRLAAECGLSVRHFSRAFVRTFGMPPYRYQLRRRIEQAGALLQDARASLPAVALACGFATQSHLHRMFLAHMGCSPGEWRRMRGIGNPSATQRQSRP